MLNLLTTRYAIWDPGTLGGYHGKGTRGMRLCWVPRRVKVQKSGRFSGAPPPYYGGSWKGGVTPPFGGFEGSSPPCDFCGFGHKGGPRRCNLAGSWGTVLPRNAEILDDSGCRRVFPFGQVVDSGRIVSALKRLWTCQRDASVRVEEVPRAAVRCEKRIRVWFAWADRCPRYLQQHPSPFESSEWLKLRLVGKELS